MKRGLIWAALSLCAGSAAACSVVVVGKSASTTGCVLVGHNEDDSGELFVRNALVPARDHAAGTVLPAEKGCAQTIPQVPHTCGFFWTEVKHFKGGVSNADGFFNENGVLVVSDNAAIVPFEDEHTKLTDGGIYYNLRRAIAERATSARDAVNVATNLLMTWGYAAPGRIYTVADKDEAWTIQALKGRRFVARRCPDDGVVAVPNCITIRRIEPGDVLSPCVAAEVAKDPAFDYAKTHQGAKRWRQPSDTLRWRHLYRIAAGVDVGEDYPFSVKPTHKVSPHDLQKALSTHYEGTPDEMKPLKHGTDDVDRYLPVCRPSTVESLVCVFAETARQTELQVAPGSPCENTYRSFRPFADGIPAELDRSADAVERLERHNVAMTWQEYLAEMARPTARDGVGRFRFADMPHLVYYDAPTALEKGSSCEIAVVLVHGWGGGLIRADEQAPMMKALAKATKPGVAAPYVIAPLFPRHDLVRKHWGAIDGLAAWNASWNTKNLAVRGSANDDWRGGGDAVGTSLSSYDVIDRIFATLADRTRFPNLRRVVLTGFSAGGQFAGRYAAVGKGVVREGVEVAYAAMAPSTELWFLPDVKWHYGLKGRPRYSAALSEDAIMANLTSRRVWRGCGAKDVLGRPFTSLDSCAEAMMQGTNRYDRFQHFAEYLMSYPAWQKQVSFHTFPHIGHKTVIAHSDPAFVDFVINGR